MDKIRYEEMLRRLNEIESWCNDCDFIFKRHDILCNVMMLQHLIRKQETMYQVEINKLKEEINVLKSGRDINE